MAFAKLFRKTEQCHLGQPRAGSAPSEIPAPDVPAVRHPGAEHLAVERTGATTSPPDGNPAKVSSSGTSPAPDKPEPRHLAGPSVPGP